jgi:hypothetical protein
MHRRVVLWLGLVALLATGCSSANQSLVLIGGNKVDAESIDKNPLHVLPRGAIVVGHLDAQALFRTSIGTEVQKIVTRLLPLGAESNFSPSRDIEKVYAAVYAMQGADFCGVLQGRFDVQAIARAADAQAATPSGVPVVKTRYGDNDLYTVANIGFTVLTPNTILSGNETGMRRALDRLRFGRFGQELPIWMVEVVEKKGAAFSLVGDLAEQAVVAASADQIPFMAGLRMVRILGNFEAPGMNVVGTLGYRDPATAASGATNLGAMKQLAYMASLLQSWGLAGSTPELDIQQNGNDVSFATKMDTTTVNQLLQVLGRVFELPGSD